MSPESMDFNGPWGQTVMENSENNESQIEGSLWAKGSKKSKILNPESMDFNGPRGPKMIEKIEKMSPKSMDFSGELHGRREFAANLAVICRIEGFQWDKGSKNDRKNENNESQIEGFHWANLSNNDRTKRKQ